jgi:hypothetical protein
MLYNDVTNKTGVCQEIDSICGTNTTTYPLEDKLRRMNSAFDDFFFIAMKECGNWSIESTDRNDFTYESTTDLVATQYDYSFPSELLILEKVEIALPDGTFKELSVGSSPTNRTSGVATSYIRVGNSLMLDYIPNYNSTAGLRITYRRAMNYATLSGGVFTPTTPAIPSIFHTWLARKSSLPYLIDKGLQKKNDYVSLIIQDEANIAKYFGEKPRDIIRRLTPVIENNR